MRQSRCLGVFGLLGALAIALPAVGAVSEYEVTEGRFYEAKVIGSFTEADVTNANAVGICYVSFDGREGACRVIDTLMTGFVPCNEFLSYEYFYSDQAVCNEGTTNWLFHVRAPRGARRIKLETKPWKNIGSISVELSNLREIPCLIQDASFRGGTECPLPSASDAIPLLPSQNSPLYYDYEVDHGDQIDVDLALSAKGLTNDLNKAALLMVKFMDDKGCPISTGRLAHSARFGEYVYLACGPKESRLHQHFTAPSRARKLRLGVARFFNRHEISLASFAVNVMPLKPKSPLVNSYKWQVPEGALLNDSELILQSLDQWIGAGEWSRMLDPASQPIRGISGDFSFILGQGHLVDLKRGKLRLNGFPIADISPKMDWQKDPFGNRTWKLKFLSLYWLPFAGEGLSSVERYELCRAYMDSFLSSNAYPNGWGGMVYDDHVCSVRIAAILMMMFGAEDTSLGIKLEPLVEYLRKDGPFFRRLMYQLMTDVSIVYYHLRAKTYLLHNHNLIMANGLLAFADAFRGHSFADRYRQKALEVIFSHFHDLFEADGFIREQSVLYHHSFMQMFFALYSYMRQHQSVSADRLEDMRNRLARILAVDVALCPPDGYVVPMGDTARDKIITADRLETNKLFKATGERIEVPDWTNGVFALEKSGLYVFRNNGRYLLIDVSPSLKVHGHRDMGSFQYFSRGHRWITDLGGPYKYGTSTYRNFIQSSSHNVAGPIGRPQAAGIAYNVKLQEYPEGWIFSFDSNVYGADYPWHRAYFIANDLSAFAIKDIFPPSTKCTSRIYMGSGISVAVNNLAAVLSSGEAQLWVEMSTPPKLEKAQASYRSNELTEVNSIVDEWTGEGRAVVLDVDGDAEKVKILEEKTVKDEGANGYEHCGGRGSGTTENRTVFEL